MNYSLAPTYSFMGEPSTGIYSSSNIKDVKFTVDGVCISMKEISDRLNKLENEVAMLKKELIRKELVKNTSNDTTDLILDYL